MDRFSPDFNELRGENYCWNNKQTLVPTTVMRLVFFGWILFYLPQSCFFVAFLSFLYLCFEMSDLFYFLSWYQYFSGLNKYAKIICIYRLFLILFFYFYNLSVPVSYFYSFVFPFLSYVLVSFVPAFLSFFSLVSVYVLLIHNKYHHKGTLLAYTILLGSHLGFLL